MAAGLGGPLGGNSTTTVRTRSGHISSGTFVPVSAKNSAVPAGTLHSHSPQWSLRALHVLPECISHPQACPLTPARDWTLTSYPTHIAAPNLWPRHIPHPVCKAVPAGLALD